MGGCLSVSQEILAKELGVVFATVNCCERRKAILYLVSKEKFIGFCKESLEFEE
jgi:hypothetical protein